MDLLQHILEDYRCLRGQFEEEPDWAKEQRQCEERVLYDIEERADFRFDSLEGLYPEFVEIIDRFRREFIRLLRAMWPHSAEDCYNQMLQQFGPDIYDEQIEQAIQWYCNRCLRAQKFPEWITALDHLVDQVNGDLEIQSLGGYPSMNSSWVPLAALVIASAIATAVAVWAASALAPAVAPVIVRAFSMGVGSITPLISATAEEATRKGKQYKDADELANDAYQEHHSELENIVQDRIGEALTMSGLSIAELTGEGEQTGLPISLPSIAELAATFSLPTTLG